MCIRDSDKPILDNITDSAVAIAMREGLKNLYSVLKGADEHLRFVFLTGVSKFSKVSLFSGLNNLQDITLMPEYSAICGYTDADVDTVFAPCLLYTSPRWSRERPTFWSQRGACAVRCRPTNGPWLPRTGRPCKPHWPIRMRWMPSSPPAARA